MKAGDFTKKQHLDRPLKYIAHLLIRFYQKFVSPYKGFRCAHAAFHGGDSCSEAVRKIILEKGVIRGYADTRKRFKECTRAFEQIKAQNSNKDKPDKKQRSCKDRVADNGACSPCDCIPRPGPPNCEMDSPCDC